MTYTVKTVMPTGKAHDQFGTEYYVQFNEMGDAPALWFKKQPEVGDPIDLEKNDKGQWKKVKKEWKPNEAPQTNTATASKPAWKDNSDGMRQGMCFNNAANYVNTLEFDSPLTDREWADTVFAYAQALYRKGDLNVAPEGSQDGESVKDKFKNVA